MPEVPKITPFAYYLLLLTGWMALAPAGLRASEDVTAAWELLARHQPSEAAARLSAPSGAGEREAALARAVVMLATPPVSAHRLQEVADQLGKLAAGDDEIASAAAYLTGRLYQVYFFQPDYPRAAQAYEQLAARHPDSSWAQLGLVKLALLRLYALPEPAEPAARLAAAEALLARLTRPDLQRDLHIVLGRAALFHGQPTDRVLAHLLAADRIGGMAGLKRGELQLQIAELSRREGRWEQARTFFQRFAAENEADGRLYTVNLKLAEIAARTPGGKTRP